MVRLQVAITDRAMLAAVRATAGPAVGAAELAAALAAAGVVHGIDGEALAAFAAKLADPAFTGECALARGDAVEAGADGRIDGVATGRPQAGSERGDGSVDFRERTLLVPAAAGAVLGRIVAPTAGRDGRDVRGNVVAARAGKPHREACGPGARIDGDTVVAARAGVLLRDARRMDVVPLHEHKGNVDYASGNLHTEGSLAVRGDVGDGFSATAGGDLHVHGSVLGGTAKAGANLRIDHGVLGAGATASAGASLVCRHATAATLLAGETLDLLDQAANCQLRAGALRAVTGRGVVFGGEARTRTGMQVRTAGTPGGAATHFVVGDVSEHAASQVRARNLDAKVADRALDRTARSGGGKAARLGMRAADAEIADLLQLRQKQRDLLAGAVVEVLDTLHVGVRVTFGTASWTSTDARIGIRLRWSPDDEAIHEERIQ